MAIVQVIDSHERDLGGFVVRRVLPAAARQMLGPFIFFDHLGPVQFPPGAGIDVRPHPHVALAAVTYLFDGALEHRDSVGSVRVILPGDVNWMTAGQGITHSERTPQATRAEGPRAHGIQSWVALPDGHEDVAPEFAHHPAATLPKAHRGRAEVTVLAGAAYGAVAPVATLWPTLYVDAKIPAGATLDLPSEHEERGVYVVEGSVTVGDTPLHAGQLGVLEPDHGALHAVTAARVMLVGGAKFPTPRFMYWNFVASSRERIEVAKQRWANGQFPPVPGESEFIPLPSR